MKKNKPPVSLPSRVHEQDVPINADIPMIEIEAEKEEVKPPKSVCTFDDIKQLFSK